MAGTPTTSRSDYLRRHARVALVGLFTRLYMQARVFLLAAELNAVLSTRGWPRSFLGP